MQLALEVWSIHEIAEHLRTLVESDERLGDLWVRGEVSNFKRYPSGHLYFSLKDAQAAIRCVMWRSAASRLPQHPQDGELVFAHGKFTLYEARGELQLVCDDLERHGSGVLYREFELLKEKLAREGLFDTARKRPLPLHPRGIGVVTSREGAALRDILSVLRRRYPLVRIYLAHTKVQGDLAPAEICEALGRIQYRPEVELVILARGGGSLEDLWAFNDERVARAICACRVPVVTGVGHETDYTIADFCADLRAPTPTGAAHLVTPDQNELRANLLLYRKRLQQSIHEALAQAKARLSGDRRAFARTSPAARISAARQRVDDLTGRASRQFERQLQLDRERLDGRLRQLAALDPQATLKRGYAIVRKPGAGPVVTHTREVAPGEPLQVRVGDGEFAVRVAGGETDASARA